MQRNQYGDRPQQNLVHLSSARLRRQYCLDGDARNYQTDPTIPSITVLIQLIANINKLVSIIIIIIIMLVMVLTEAGMPGKFIKVAWASSKFTKQRGAEVT